MDVVSEHANLTEVKVVLTRNTSFVIMLTIAKLTSQRRLRWLAQNSVHQWESKQPCGGFGCVPVCLRKAHFFGRNTHRHMHFLTNLCQFFKMGSANVRLRHFVTGFSLSKGVRVMVECNPIKKISAWQLQGEGIRSNFQPSCQIKVVLK